MKNDKDGVNMKKKNQEKYGLRKKIKIQISFIYLPFSEEGKNAF